MAWMLALGWSAPDTGDIRHWSALAFIVVLAYVGLWVLRRTLHPALRRSVAGQMDGQPQLEIDKRIKTLSNVIYRTAVIVVVLLVALTMLPDLGVNISALLAGTSLIAVAVGFGAQSLVKDVISGLFILIENQYGVGDVVNIASVGGVVEDINLRRTVLRDLDGAIHSVPNGQVLVSSNLTRTWSRANMLVGVSYSEDLDHVFEVINRVGVEMKVDPQWSHDLIEAPVVLGVEEFGDSAISIRVLGVTQPIRQWDVMRELRKRIKHAFDVEGIEIPYPHRTIVTAGQKAADGIVIREDGHVAVRANGESPAATADG